MVPLSLGCGSAVFAAIATLAPSRAARSAIARPMPRLAPEMNSVLPLRDVMGLAPGFSSALATIYRANLRQPLLPHRRRAARARIGRAEQAVRGDGDRIRRGLAERFDHLVAFRPQLGQQLVGN